MIKKLWNWICSFFTAENIGIIWRTIFNGVKENVCDVLHDPKVQETAFSLALNLMTGSDGKSGEDKAKEFDDAMRQWLISTGKEVSTSTLNCIRELAVEAVKESEAKASAPNGGGGATAAMIAVVCSLLCLGASAATVSYDLKAGRNIGYSGKMVGWSATSSNATATVTISQVADTFVPMTYTVAVTGYVDHVMFTNRVVVTTNEYMLTNFKRVVLETNNCQVSVHTKVPRIRSVTKTVASLVSSHTNSIASATLENGEKRGTDSAFISNAEYLVVGGTIVNDKTAKVTVFIDR